MADKTQKPRWLRLISVVFCLVGCTLSRSLSPTAVPTMTPMPTATPDPDWTLLAQGLESRRLLPDGNFFGQMLALRIDPNRYIFRAHYRPGEPFTLSQWQLELPDAVAIINANFFSPQNIIQGLLVADGQAHGQSYVGRGGMFQVQNGMVRVRSLIQEPYSGEAFEQAVQAFPMLVLNGVRAYVPSPNERSTRRTVIAQDHLGQILLFVTPLTGLSLADLSRYLATADLGIVNALNLDGGGSTMLYVQGNGPGLGSLDPVPAVLAVYRR